MSDWPKLLYRHSPEADRIDGVHCEYMAVNDAAEEKAGKSDGWHDNVADAAPKVKATKAEPAKSDDDPRPALRKEYEELSGKRAFGGWSAEQLGEKIAALKEAQ